MKKTPARKSPAKKTTGGRTSTKSAADRAATTIEVVAEPALTIDRPVGGASTKTPAKKTTSTAARTAAAKNSARASGARSTGAKSAAARTTAAKSTAAKSNPATAAKSSTAARATTPKATAAKSATAKSTASKTAAAKAAAEKSAAAKSSARTTAARSAAAKTAAAKAAAAKAAAAKAAAAEADEAEAAAADAEVAQTYTPSPEAESATAAIDSQPAPDSSLHGPSESDEAPAAKVGIAEAAPETAAPQERIAEEPPVEETIAEERPVEEAPVEEAPVEETTADEATDEAVLSDPDVVGVSDADVSDEAVGDVGAASATEAIRLRGLVKTFGDHVAVNGIDLTVPAGSFYGIVGPNGAGKTTTLSIVAGLLRADAGEVVICGIDQAAKPLAAKRMMGVLPDRLRTFDRLTGRQLLYYYGLLRGLTSDVIEKRVGDLARAFDLGEALNRVVSDYSAGMTKKIMLAGAMIHSPRVLVLDEPFEAVDPVSSAVILDILRAYVAHGGTVILSSHGMDLVERVCSRVAIIVGGDVLAEGTIDEVRAGQTLEARFVELSGGIGEVEGLEWLHTFSD
ncbi:ABC-2 type transport system ATP-binding protein [Microbacterium hydrocarbonoxydans]|uniref:ABC-2 type transport system ATP-binding protein n=1 Tax=Microbacterium hydrocarbonoxydans TaxID=273678 RepID=A0A1H4KHT4_9MICO|nr:ABC-2 type transport system ATP-binding protein [Microbacterium hydrocarbonoxydans]